MTALILKLITSISKKNWNKINQRIKVNKIESHAIEKNKRLDKFNRYVEELIYNYYQNQTKLDSDRIKFDLALSQRKKSLSL